MVAHRSSLDLADVHHHIQFCAAIRRRLRNFRDLNGCRMSAMRKANCHASFTLLPSSSLEQRCRQ